MWQFENDKIWASYNKKNVIKESIHDDYDMTDDEVKGIIDDIYSSYQDGVEIPEIAEYFDIEEKDVEEAINIAKKSNDLESDATSDKHLIDRYGLKKANTRNTVKKDPSKRTDTIDFEEVDGKSVDTWDEFGNKNKGRANVNDVPQQKSRRQMIGSRKINR